MTTHSTSAKEAPRSRAIVGRTTATTLVSSTVIAHPVEAVRRTAREAPGLKLLPPPLTSPVARGRPPKHRRDAACHHLCERAWGDAQSFLAARHSRVIDRLEIDT